MNSIMYEGKKSTAERIVYSALEQCRRKTGNDPVTTLKRAVENVRPYRSVRVIGPVTISVVHSGTASGPNDWASRLSQGNRAVI